MGAREKALKLLFEEISSRGVESIPKETLKQLFKSSRKKLYRHEWNPEQLLEKGFQSNHPETGDYGDIPGLYFHKNPKYFQSHPGESMDYGMNVEGLKRPGATTKNTYADKYYESRHIPTAGNTYYDFMTRRGGETIQLKPNNTLAKIKIKDKEYYRLIGLAAALGLAPSTVEEMLKD